MKDLMKKKNTSKKVLKHHDFYKKKFSEKKSSRQNRISSETAEFPNFFADSFLKLNYLQVHVKKVKLFDLRRLSCPEA